jgi:hypothetical protein
MSSEYNEKEYRGIDPRSLEKIASHEPTAVKTSKILRKVFPVPRRNLKKDLEEVE